MLVFDWLMKRFDLERLGRFALVGALGTGLDVGLLMLLTALVNVPTLPANVLSYSAGIVNNYTWNRRWTFKRGRQGAWLPQVSQFGLVSLIGLGINSFIVFLLEDLAGLFPAKLMATGFVLLWNYNANRLWTFAEAAQAEAA